MAGQALSRNGTPTTRVWSFAASESRVVPIIPKPKLGGTVEIEVRFYKHHGCEKLHWNLREVRQCAGHYIHQDQLEVWTGTVRRKQGWL